MAKKNSNRESDLKEKKTPETKETAFTGEKITERIEKRRTQLESYEDISLSDIAANARAVGYNVKVKPGGSLFITSDDSILKDASVTVTKKNAYIENALLKNPQEQELYKKMVADVRSSMEKAKSVHDQKMEAYMNSPMLADCSVRDLLSSYYSIFEMEQADPDSDKGFDTLYCEDAKGNQTITINRDYTIDEKPIIEVSFGEKYGNVKKTFEITPEEMKNFSEGNFYKSKVASEIESFINAGLETIETYQQYDKKISDLDMNYEVYSDARLTYSSKEKPAPNYDREWINKLASLEDKLTEFRNGPVQETFDSAKYIARTLKDITLGLVEPYKDGVLSGVELFNGRKYLSEGAELGNMLYNMEKYYKTISNIKGQEENTVKTAIQLKYLRESMIKNANAYARAAAGVRYHANKLVDLVHEAKLSARASIERKKGEITAAFNQTITRRIANLGQKIAQGFKDLKTTSHNLLSDFAKFALTVCPEKEPEIKEATEKVERSQIEKLDTFKTLYNESMKDAATIFDDRKYKDEILAGAINDIRVVNNMEGMTVDDFKKIQKNLFWSELDKTIEKGQKASRKLHKSPDDLEAIRMGKMAKQQQTQNKYISRKIADEIDKKIMKEPMTRAEAVSIIAKVYHESAVIYNDVNAAGNYKPYESLSGEDRKLCQEIASDIISGLPVVEEHLAESSHTDGTKGKEDFVFDDPVK